MPAYDFLCQECRTVDEIGMSFEDYDKWREGESRLECSTCGSPKMERVLCVTPHVEVRLADSEVKKLGHWADRQTKKMSADEKRHREYKDTQYLRDRDNPELVTK